MRSGDVMASILWVPALFIMASSALYLISINSPPIYPHRFDAANNKSVYNVTEQRGLRFPQNIEELGEVAVILRQYRTDHLQYVVLLFCCAYLYKQTFAIPGSVFMNLLAGATFGLWYGFPLVCFLTATGATLCFLLSSVFGKQYVLRYLPDKVSFLQGKVQENSDSLFFFLLFLRLLPMSPNWLLNIVSPLVNVPMHLFFVSVLLGLVPYNFICVETGVMLSEISSISGVFTSATLLKLLVIALMALLPGIFVKKNISVVNTRLKSE